MWTDRRLVFDHVYKTGGLAISEALRRVLPSGTVSPHLHPYVTPVHLGQYIAYPHLVGHFGRNYRQYLPEFERRLTATVIRDPVSRVVSLYSFWRFNHPRSRGVPVVFAHDLSFSEFIRANLPYRYMFLLNGQTEFLDGPLRPLADPQAVSSRILDQYKIVGITNDLSSFLQRILLRLGVEMSKTPASILAQSNSNASWQRITVNDEDRRFLEEQQVYDMMLYRLARERANAD